MARIYNHIITARIWTDDCGQDMIEYALIAGALALAAVAVAPPFLATLSQVMSAIADKITSAATSLGG
ncbi:MAG: Flp family type IVb pilin [Bryobacterales bacterium]|nr:Flp family type IVb pilin [Bryobacterales bacterium]